ncbi:transcriptional regulator of NAD metabolism [Scopulibacillus daqui]|uniref:Transcriptional regulator of NAD metabolism n=1 Tax=Scopulibacillus daqui TaxID=1469162 RepID=A0ABS2PZK5_9BACL|nr:transcription repressor NadR [Scopulibacillus daqui]MBM7644707.1 transcriptional regulator of NAD metabolism [Scopulibacillus daqui]
MTKQKKVLGETRRSFILKQLKESPNPVTGSHLAKLANVSRQVIVQDISLLKARNHPIMATAQGYIYMDKQQSISRIIACQHSREETENELNIIVDHGVTVKNVIVEHPVYGEITASLMIKNRHDVKNFIENIKKMNASLLLSLTGGPHLHTIEADSEKLIDDAIMSLEKAGYLL